MLQKETLIQDIRKGLAVFQNYIGPGGGLNLTDTNVHAEDFVAELLNALYDWNLVNVNRKNANCPCIDLIDVARRVGVQVTSEKGSDKLAATIECSERHGLAERIQGLKVFSLVKKQRQYTTKAKCPGITFDWRTDVLDFDDVVKAATATSDLQRLQRVQQCVVRAMPSIFPDQRKQILPLRMPLTDPSSASLAFSSRSTQLVGRDAEFSQLSGFLNSTAKFSWWLVAGAAGSGKSRLALELCRAAAPAWQAGFLSRADKAFNWAEFSATRKTLIVIDYVAGRAPEVSDIVITLARASGSLENQTRVLLVERDRSSWWTTFIREESQSESAELAACQYREPLDLDGLSVESLLRLGGDVVNARGGKWNFATAKNFLKRLAMHDPSHRPLFAIIVAEYLDVLDAAPDGLKLLQVVLRKEAARRRELIQDPEKLKRLENLLLLATLVGGLMPKTGTFNHVASSEVYDLLPDVGLLDEDLYNDIAGSARGTTAVAGLQPDILGERFLLDRLSETGIAGQNAQRLLLAAWSIQPGDVGVVARRCAFDFPTDTELRRFFELPLGSAEARSHWAAVVAQFVVRPRVFENSLARDQHRKLISLADENSREPELQNLAALADYNIAVSTMFEELEYAAERFDAARVRAGTDSPIGTMALLNRGILYERANEDTKAVEAFGKVIDSRKVSDEVRACALNNRAQMYLRRGDHDRAIRDRTEVIALRDTSADRRFVALFGRSESYAALGEYEPALSDLHRILKTDDITRHDKLHAELECAVVLHSSGNQNEARALLQSTIDSRSLPWGTSPHLNELVNKTEDCRRAGDYDNAVRYLEQAMRELEARGESDIRIAIIATMLVEDQSGDLDAVKQVWEKLRSLFRRGASRTRVAQPQDV